MQTFGILTRFQLKYYLKPNFANPKEKRRYFATLAIILVAFLPLTALILMSVFSMAKVAIQLQIADELLSMVLLGIQLMSIFLGTMTYLQIMYFSKDNELLSALPIGKSQIFFSKFLVAFVLQWGLSFVFMLIAGIAIAVAYAQSALVVPWTYYCMIPIGSVLVSMMSVLILSILAMPIMKLVTFFRKHPSFGAIFGLVITIAIVAAVYIPMYSDMGSTEDNGMISQETMQNLFAVGRYWYPTLFLSRAMLAVSASYGSIALGPWACFALSIVIPLAMLGLGTVLCRVFYRSTLDSLSESAGATYRVTKTSYQQNSPVRALVVREFRTIIRDAQLTMMAFMQVLMAPFMLWLMTWVFGKTPAEGAEQVQQAAAMRVGIVIFMSMMFLTMNNYAAIAFSAEGKNFSILRTLPVSGEQVFRAKYLFLMIPSTVTVVLCLIVSAAMGVWNVIDAIAYIPVMLGISVCVQRWVLMRDLHHPRLDWLSIREITKNNFSMILPMMISMLIGFLLAGAYVLMLALPLPTLAVSGIYWGTLLVLSAIANVTVWKLSRPRIESYYRAIEA